MFSRLSTMVVLNAVSFKSTFFDFFQKINPPENFLCVSASLQSVCGELCLVESIVNLLIAGSCSFTVTNRNSLKACDRKLIIHFPATCFHRLLKKDL